jgi:hypothetical protein
VKAAGQVTQRTAASAEEGTLASGKLRSASARLVELMKGFKTGDRSGRGGRNSKGGVPSLGTYRLRRGGPPDPTGLHRVTLTNGLRGGVSARGGRRSMRSRRATDADDDLALPIAAEPGSTDAKRKRARQEAKAKAVATSLGLDPSFDLPASGEGTARRHMDRVLQTLILPEELESVLRKIHQKARTEIQEKGANVLHLMFGFIEWSDVPESQTSRADVRLAPLVLVPAGIERGRLDTSTRPRTYLYSVKATGEDWGTNVTLQEKCRRELKAEFPGIEDDEQLETYFARIEAWLASNTDCWRLRRYVTLGLVSFGKILMWRDLDPKTWPRELGLLRNPLLREVLGEDSAEGSAPGILADEYRIDDPSPALQVPPIVMDADSSQHSVLVDVAKGRNLVVQGPPGTGKSQTIANLIAAEISGESASCSLPRRKRHSMSSTVDSRESGSAHTVSRSIATPRTRRRSSRISQTGSMSGEVFPTRATSRPSRTK